MYSWITKLLQKNDVMSYKADTCYCPTLFSPSYFIAARGSPYQETIINKKNTARYFIAMTTMDTMGGACVEPKKRHIWASLTSGANDK